MIWISVYVLVIGLQIFCCIQKREYLGLFLPIIVGVFFLSLEYEELYWLLIAVLSVFIFILFNRFLIRKISSKDIKKIQEKSIIKDL
jgi:low affinity Fe/Cu permease